MPAFDEVRRTKQAYDQVFSAPGCDQVLADLAKFCRAEESTFDPDARIHAVHEGRREVWLRIQRHLRLTPTQLLEYMNPNVKDSDHE